MERGIIQLIVMAMIFLILTIILYKKIFPDPFVDEIYSNRDYKTYTDEYDSRTYQGMVRRIVIKRTYSSGRIKFIEKEVKI